MWMIEVATYPDHLDDWKPEHAPSTNKEQSPEVEVGAKEFYLELYGETSPLVDMNFAQVVPAGIPDAAPQTTQSAPIYEYWWTIGHGGFSDHQEHFWDQLGQAAPRNDLWHDLRDPVATRVYLFFPINAGWRIKELISTIKYLTPIKGQQSLMEKASKHWNTATPLVGDLGQVAGALSIAPGVGVAAAGASTLLSAMSKMQVNNVPQANGFEWSTAKVSSKIQDHGVMHGVMWTLPKKMFTELGGRITGSVALSFIPARAQEKTKTVHQDAVPLPDEPIFETGAVLAHAVVYGSKRSVWVPDQRQFVELRITPTKPT